VGYTTGRDLHPAPKVRYSTNGIIPFSVRAVKSYLTLLKLRSPLKRGSAGIGREKACDSGKGMVLQGGKSVPYNTRLPEHQGYSWRELTL